MNSEELVKEINKRLKDSGIVTLVQHFARNNPNYWTNCKNEPSKKICSCAVSIALTAMPESIGTAVPFMSVDIGSFNTEIAMLWDHTMITGGTVRTEIRGKEHD